MKEYGVTLFPLQENRAYLQGEGVPSGATRTLRAQRIFLCNEKRTERLRAREKYNIL